MRFEITTLKYSLKDIIAPLSFYLTILSIFILLFYFALDFSLDNIIISSLTTLLTIVFIFSFNKNSVLSISEFDDPAEIKDVTTKVLSKKGLIKTFENGNETKYELKSKLNRFLSSSFKDYVTLKESDNEILLYGKKNTLVSLKMRVKQEFPTFHLEEEKNPHQNTSSTSSSGI